MGRGQGDQCAVRAPGNFRVHVVQAEVAAAGGADSAQVAAGGPDRRERVGLRLELGFVRQVQVGGPQAIGGSPEATPSTKAIRLPSGDQLGPPEMKPLSLWSSLSPVPSAETT